MAKKKVARKPAKKKVAKKRAAPAARKKAARKKPAKKTGRAAVQQGPFQKLLEATEHVFDGIRERIKKRRARRTGRKKA